MNGYRSASETAARLVARSQPIVIKVSTPASRARARTASRSLSKRASSRCVWVSINTGFHRSKAGSLAGTYHAGAPLEKQEPGRENAMTRLTTKKGSVTSTSPMIPRSASTVARLMTFATISLFVVLVIITLAPFAAALEVHHLLAAADQDGHQHSDSDLCQWVQHHTGSSMLVCAPAVESHVTL